MIFGEQISRRSYIFRVVLIYALVLLSVALPLTVSRYLSQDDGDDSAEVAQFDISQSGMLTQTIEVEFGEAWSKELDIVLENHGAVDVIYTVTVVRDTENLPLTLTWDGNVEEAVLKSGAADTRILTVAWTGAHDSAYSGEIDRVRVTVVCEQID